jgi:hypothetical protein
MDALLEQAAQKGRDSVDFATIGFGVGQWHLYSGHRERARQVFAEVAASPHWHAFGRIASEVELSRM